jgi:NAD-dependent dihydropyrimidine dehydrogenase PreA subunit
MGDKETKNLKDIFKEIEEERCLLQRVIRLLDEFIDGPMCGRCLPCPMGSYEMRVRVRRLTEGEGTKEDIEIIKAIAPKMFVTSMCKRGKDVADFIDKSLKQQEDIYIAHAEGCCPDRQCKALFIYRIIPDNCTMCGDCLEVCKDYAIVGEKKLPYKTGYLPFEIIPVRCTRCGECVKVCKYNAIEIIDIGVKEEEEEAVKV